MAVHEPDSIGSMTAGPRWSAVPFEVGCARCGYDLRGLTEPKCPRCELEFDWADAVPIEKLTCLHCGYHLYGLVDMRCPECGESFTWQAVLDEYHRQQIPLFEYHWRDKRFQSMVKTWWLALRPTKFWSKITMHDPPHVGPLVVMACLYILLLHVFVAIAFAVMSQANYWMGQRYNGPPNLLWLRGPPPTFLDYALNLLHEVYGNLLQADLVITLATWMLSSYLALLIFQQSMRRYHVRNVHLVRVWVYSIPLIPLLVLAITPGFLFTIWRASAWPVTALLCILFIATTALVVRSIQVAYKKYLLMPHSWAVAISVQLIAVFAGLTASTIALWGWWW